MYRSQMSKTEHQCPFCQGTGKVRQTTALKCEACGGRGSTKCAACAGRGYVEAPAEP
jgi:RecJ-like exonuclease